MTMSAWLVGVVTLPAQAFDGGTGGGNIEVDAGTYYLRHGTAGLSLLDTLAADWTTELGLAVTIVVQRNRRIRIDIAAPGAVIEWTGVGNNASALRDILGFVGNRTSATSHVAEYPSPLLWSPGYIATPKTRNGRDGYTVPHQSVYKSDDGTQKFVAHYGDETWQDLGWSHIEPDRMQVADTENGGGTFNDFWEQVAKYGRRFTWYPEIDEDDASSTAVTWTTARGPYTLREVDGDWYRRVVPNAEVSCSLELPIHQLAELT